MLSVVSTILASFGLLVWSSFRRERRGERFRPEGKLRWDSRDGV